MRKTFNNNKGRKVIETEKYMASESRTSSAGGGTIIVTKPIPAYRLLTKLERQQIHPAFYIRFYKMICPDLKPIHSLPEP